MAVLQSLTYQCDVAGCDTPPFVETDVVYFNSALRRPCVPNGWVYLGEIGIMCARHGAKFDVLTRKFFVEPGHE